MDPVSVGAALALVEGMIPGLAQAVEESQQAAGGANEAAAGASAAAANAANNDKALSQCITMTYAIMRQQQKEISDLKAAVAALAT